MKKVLFIAHIDQHIRHFHLPYIKWFKTRGYEVHVASCGDDSFDLVEKKYNIPFRRNPFSYMNFKAYKMLKSIIEREKYVLVHCHTPVGGAIGRLAARNERKHNTKVLYTAHGFHFYKGAPILNWLIYFSVEKILSRFTDCILTINNEDYELALKKYTQTCIRKVNGVGVDFKLNELPEMQKNNEFHLLENDILIVSVGELNKNKNHEFMIKLLAKLNNYSFKYLIVGEGHYKRSLELLINKNNLESKVKLLGYRKDIYNILQSADIFLFPSKREGLPVALMEAMYCGLPVVCSNIRGNSDLIVDQKGGYCIDLKDENVFLESITYLFENNDKCSEFGKFNKNRVKKFELNKVIDDMEDVYLSYLE